MARANTMSAGAGDGERPAPREFAEELRAISDADGPEIVVASAEQQLQSRVPAGPQARQEGTGERQPAQSRPPHRVIPARRAQAQAEAAAEPRTPVEPRPIRRATEPAEEEDMAKAADAAAAIGARWTPKDEDAELIRVLCFLEERTLPEIVEAVVRDYIESRAEDADVRAVMDAREKYRRV